MSWKTFETTVSQIYPGRCVPNFIRIEWVLWQIWQKHLVYIIATLRTLSGLCSCDDDRVANVRLCRLLVDCRPHLCSYSWVLSVCRLIPCPVMTLSFQDFLAWPVNVMTWFSFVTWSVIAAVFISGIKSFRSARVIMFLSQKGTKTTLSTAKLLSYVNVLLLIDSTTFLCSSCRFNSFYIPVSPMHVDYRYSCGTESCIHHLSVRLCICRSGGLDDFLMPREVSWQCLPVVTEDSFCNSLWQPFYMSNAYTSSACRWSEVIFS